MFGTIATLVKSGLKGIMIKDKNKIEQEMNFLNDKVLFNIYFDPKKEIYCCNAFDVNSISNLWFFDTMKGDEIWDFDSKDFYIVSNGYDAGATLYSKEKDIFYNQINKIKKHKNVFYNILKKIDNSKYKIEHLYEEFFIDWDKKEEGLQYCLFFKIIHEGGKSFRFPLKTNIDYVGLNKDKFAYLPEEYRYLKGEHGIDLAEELMQVD